MSVLWTSPAWSWPLLLVVAAGAVFLTIRFYGQSRPHPTEGLRRTLVFLRTGALLLLVLAVAGPVFSRLFKQDVPGQLVFLMEDSASMGLAVEPSEIGQAAGTRWSSALASAALVDSALSSRGLNVNTRLLRGNGMGDLHEFRLSDPVIVDPQKHGTDLSSLLEKASNRLSVDPVGAVVLLSDGQETVGGGNSLGAVPVFSGAELFVMGVGDPEGSLDRLIKDIRYPETAFQGDAVTLEATVLQRLNTSISSQTFTAYLKQGDRILAQTTMEAGSGATNFELSFIPDEAGLQMLELEVSPLGNERYLANNRVSLGIDVHKARARLLVLAERPGWNVRFLTQAAKMENRLSLEVVYLSEKGLVFADSLQLFETPENIEQWLEFDGVILAGWSGMVGRLDHALLGKAVDAGLGLMILPEPMESSAGRLRAPSGGLLDLLPVVLQQLKWERGPLFAELDSLALDHPVFSGLNITPGTNPLSQSPPLGATVQCRLKDGSKALLVATKNARGQGESVPLLVVRNQQLGRLAFWSGSRLWEMTFWENTEADPETSSGHTVRRALRNLLVWLADGNRQSGLNFSGRRAFYQEGENIRLAAQWRDMRGQAEDQGRLSLEVGRIDGSGDTVDMRSFPFNGYDSTRGEYEFLVPAMPPGRYSIQLLGHGDSMVEGPKEELIVTSHSVEQTQVRQNGRRLRQLADRLGGAYLNSSEPTANEQLIAQLAGLQWENSPLENRKKWDPSSGWPFLVTVVLLLGCEWFLRRRHGLL